MESRRGALSIVGVVGGRTPRGDDRAASAGPTSACSSTSPRLAASRASVLVCDAVAPASSRHSGPHAAAGNPTEETAERREKVSERQEIERKLREFVAPELLRDEGDVELTSTTNLQSRRLIDSISIVSLRIFVERTLQVHLPEGAQPAEFAGIATMADLIEPVRQEHPR